MGRPLGLRRRRVSDRTYVGFSTTGHLVSGAIRRLSQAEVSHAWFCHGNHLWGGAWITEADYPSVRALPYEVATASWTRITVFEVSPHFALRIEAAMRAQRTLFGRPFDVRGLAGMALLAGARRLGLGGRDNLLANPDQVFCSELVASVLRATGAEAFRRWRPKERSPRSVQAACVMLRDIFRPVTPKEFIDWLLDSGVPRSGIRPEIIFGHADA